jgi:hypothetical protein
MAQTILNTLHPKWSPLHRIEADGLDLTPRKQRNKQAQKNNRPIIFDPNVTQVGLTTGTGKPAVFGSRA